MEQAAQGGGGVSLGVFSKRVDVVLRDMVSGHGGNGLIVGIDYLTSIF